MDAFDETGFSSATYKVLYQIAEGATREESLFEFGGSLHRLLAELIPAKNLYLCLLSSQPGRLNFPYYVDERDGDSMQEMDVPMRKGLTEFVLRTGVTELISQERYLALQRSGDITEATGDLSFNSWLGVPLHINSQIGGVLTVQSYDSGVAYQASDAHLLSFVARHVSTAIERKQSFEALRAAHMELERETRQRRQSETLYRVFYQLAVQAARGDSLHDFCAKVHELLGQLVLAPNCYISLCDVAKGVKHFPYYVDERDGETLQKADVPLRKGLTEFVLNTDRPQRIDQARAIGKTVVQRRRRGADDVRFAPVADDAGATEILEGIATGFTAGAHPQRQLAAALFGIARGEQFQVFAQLADQRLGQPAGQCFGLGAQRRQPGAVEEVERYPQRRQRQDRRIRQLPAVGARRRSEFRPHTEARRWLVTPPAGKSWQLGVGMALMNEAAGDRAGA